MDLHLSPCRWLFALCCMGIAQPSLLLAHTDDPELARLPYLEGYEPPVPEHTPDMARHRLTHVVRRAGVLTTSDGRSLLPFGTQLDHLHWEDAIARVALTFPEKADPLYFRPVRLETIDHVLVSTLMIDQQLRGIRIVGRRGEGDYHPLVDLSPGITVAKEQASAGGEREVRRTMPAGSTTTESEVSSADTMPQIGGPSANNPISPQGSLSGVVVFVSAGHGWTAGSSSWFLQRPLLLDMVEDYGNLDQLNYFVHYLYNAGATVVPFRPVGYQSFEIVMDNDAPEVTYTGSWTDIADAEIYYDGPAPSSVHYRTAAAAPTETATARYTPDLPEADFYPVYCWASHLNTRVRQTYRIHHSGDVAEVVIDHTRIGNGWIWLGNYHFEAGMAGYVEITNASPDSGEVVADAIRFGNGMGDMVGDGPNTISGYPREEEAARYWAQSEAGVNAVGLPTIIWDRGGPDVDDNISTAARWAAEMNREDVNDERWRRIYIEFHTNAAGCSPGPTCSAKGTVALFHSTYPTVYQVQLAGLLGQKIGDDMQAIDDQFEYPWGSRLPSLGGSYGAISTQANDDEFDATILEVAFHDNIEDAANLRSAKVRDAVARSTMQGIIDFLSDQTLFPESQVIQLYPPDPPTKLRARHDGNGNIVISWSTPLSSPAGGAPPTGYRVYRSTNGYGFGQPVIATSVFGQATSKTLSDIPPYTTTYLRVAAYNDGGESMPSEVLAVRRPLTGAARVLIVDGFDRVSRHLNHIQFIPQGPMERPIARKVNSFDYVIQHAEALAAAGYTFDTCANQNVIAGQVPLADYDAVLWFLGKEGEEDSTFDATEQSLVSAYLDQGGALFVTGSEIGRDLVELGQGTAFFENQLGSEYLGSGAGTYQVTGAEGILGHIGLFDFDPAAGAPYDTDTPDRIAPQPGAVSILSYFGGTGDSAGIAYDSGIYRAVTFGFPFETITSSTAREDIMRAVMRFLAPPPLPDFDGDGDVDQADFAHLQRCFTGQEIPLTDPLCQNALLEGDGFVDEGDLAIFLSCVSGPTIPADPGCIP